MRKRDSSRRQRISPHAEITVDKCDGINYKRTLALPKNRRYARSTTEIKEGKRELRITIRARDNIALRASMNSIMRDIQVIGAVGGLKGRICRNSAKGKGI